MKIRLTRTLRRLGQELQQNSAGAPAPARAAVFAAAKFLGDGEPHAGRNLLGAQKIFVRGRSRSCPSSANKSLVAAHIRTLIDGHGEMAAAEQLSRLVLAGGDGGSDALGVKARASAHFAGRGEIDHQHADRAVALGLQNEPAFEFERGAEHDSQHDRLAQELGDRQRIVVAAQDGVDCRPKPDDAAAQIERTDFERQDRVVDAGLRRRPNRNGQIGIVHRHRI